MPPRGFWSKLPRPFIGLAPMDGVTTAPFRLLTARWGRPNVIFTEFVPTAGLMHGATKLLADFHYDESERPVVAQIYGHDPQECYAVAHLVCALGFDGLDINMGCPAKNVAARGAGAGLIRTPAVAQAMIRAAQAGVRDWCAGQSLAQVGVPASVVRAVEAMNQRSGRVVPQQRQAIPVGVKTRIGYDTCTIIDWVQVLLEADPIVISIHGRTLKQMYKGDADWEAIARAVVIIHQTPTLVLGNGDVASRAEAARRIHETGVDGILIGRAAMGNPWIFQPAAMPTARNQLDAFVEHAQLVEALCPPQAFSQLFRFVKHYTAGIPGAVAIRQQIYHVASARLLREMLQPLYRSLDIQDSHASDPRLDQSTAASAPC